MVFYLELVGVDALSDGNEGPDRRWGLLLGYRVAVRPVPVAVIGFRSKNLEPERIVVRRNALETAVDLLEEHTGSLGRGEYLDLSEASVGDLGDHGHAGPARTYGAAKFVDLIAESFPACLSVLA